MPDNQDLEDFALGYMVGRASGSGQPTSNGSDGGNGWKVGVTILAVMLIGINIIGGFSFISNVESAFQTAFLFGIIVSALVLLFTLAPFFLLWVVIGCTLQERREQREREQKQREGNQALRQTQERQRNRVTPRQ